VDFGVSRLLAVYSFSDDLGCILSFLAQSLAATTSALLAAILNHAEPSGEV
jgi:hypothetical protein